MKNILIALFLFTSQLSVAQSEGEAALTNMSKLVNESSCKNEINYKELFSFSLSGQITGASTIEWLSEINETAFFKCPEGFLRNLSMLPNIEQDKVLKYFGIVNAPWEIAAALESFENSPELGGFIKNKLSGFKKYPKP
jgi:hypothetical protein